MGSGQSSQPEKNAVPVSKNATQGVTEEKQEGGRRRTRRTRRKRSMKRRHCSHRHKRSWRHKQSRRR
jgi:hypothetical protein